MKGISFNIYLLIFLFCSSCCAGFLVDKPVFIWTDFEGKNIMFENGSYLINRDSLVMQMDLEIRTPKNRCGEKIKRLFGKPRFRVLKNLYQDTLYLDLSDTTNLFLQTNQSGYKINGKAALSNQFSKLVAIILKDSVFFFDSQLRSNDVFFEFKISEKFSDSFYPIRIFIDFGYIGNKNGKLFSLNELKGEATK